MRGPGRRLPDPEPGHDPYSTRFVPIEELTVSTDRVAAILADIAEENGRKAQRAASATRKR